MYKAIPTDQQNANSTWLDIKPYKGNIKQHA